MITSAVRIVSNVVCLVLVLSFGMFVIDEVTTASQTQTAIAGHDAQVVYTRDIHGRKINPVQTEIRQQIDRVNDTITGPAEKLVANSPSPWVMRAVPFVLGMLVFGLFMHMLANWLALSRSGGNAKVSETRASFNSGYR